MILILKGCFILFVLINYGISDELGFYIHLKRFHAKKLFMSSLSIDASLFSHGYSFLGYIMVMAILVIRKCNWSPLPWIRFRNVWHSRLVHYLWLVFGQQNNLKLLVLCSCFILALSQLQLFHIFLCNYLRVSSVVDKVNIYYCYCNAEELRYEFLFDIHLLIYFYQNND